ncbi:hypothetical protein F2Q69_00029993 [Brassica cretica]|uniref:Uncharacterized protein n=1 Tax=Brassica cretica TaxID=69181 RepID=A0A8S9S9F0_BRACR|nr:hypothetical protein F2Q69_00029993 [Brassica cretica]
MSQEHMNNMKVSHMRNFSLCKDVMKQINIDQILLGEEHDTRIRSMEHPIDRAHRPSIDIYPSTSIDIYPSTSIDINPSTSIDNRSKPITTGPIWPQKSNRRTYTESGGIDKSFKLRSPHPTRPSVDVDAPTLVDRQPEFCRRAFDSHGTRKFYWEEKDQYGVYRDEQGYT